jgi:peptidoglycan/LPS O-acetylase OafA/YrhL
MTKRRIPEFDGLRGIAVLLVVLGHYCSGIIQGVSFFSYASMAVDIFFVLSGFLIGGILLDGCGEDDFLMRFIRRRCARIMPLFIIVVASVFTIQTFIQGAPWAYRLFPAWTYVTFTMNIWSAYHASEPAPILGPPWSLCVEEQFYLLMPFLAMCMPRKTLAWLLGLLCLGAIAFRYLNRSNIEAIELLLPARFDSLGIGVGVALLQRSADLSPYRKWLKAVPLAILAIYVPAILFSHAREFLLAHTAFALLTASYMVVVLNRPATGNFLRAGWLRFLAKISYGLYLIHEPVNVLLTGMFLGKSVYAPGLDRFWVVLLSLCLSVGLAMLSRRYLEEPILRWEARTRDDTARRKRSDVPRLRALQAGADVLVIGDGL